MLLLAPAAEVGRGHAELRQVWSLVREHFLDPRLAGLDWEGVRGRYEAKLDTAQDGDDVARILNEMLAELDTSHTAYYTEDDPAYWFLLDLFHARLPLEPLQKRAAPRYVGIGIETEEIEGDVFARFVLDGGPAAKAGVLVGDRLLTVDGAPWHPIRPFRGKEGQPVELRVQRSADPASIVSLRVVPRVLAPRELYREALVASARVVERAGVPIAYAHVWSYAGQDNHDTLVGLLSFPPLAEAQALVLDLRGGWGGASPEYLNLFAEPPVTMTITDRAGETRAYPPRWRKPAVLLVDDTTRSGKEVFALGFQRGRLGSVIGTRTAGAVVAGRAFLVGERGLLYLAVGDVRVNGERLEGRGVAPDVEVPAPIPYAAGQDPVLERALEALAEQLGASPPGSPQAKPREGDPSGAVGHDDEVELSPGEILRVPGSQVELVQSRGGDLKGVGELPSMLAPQGGGEVRHVPIDGDQRETVQPCGDERDLLR